MTTKNLVLRTMYIDPDVDDELRTEAFDSRTSKNDLLRKYLRIGMEAAKQGMTLEPAPKTAATKKDTALFAVKKAGAAKKGLAAPIARKAVSGAAAGVKKGAAKTTAQR